MCIRDRPETAQSWDHVGLVTGDLDQPVRRIHPVSYTHLDVYKRQDRQHRLAVGRVRRPGGRERRDRAGLVDAQVQHLSLIHI